MRSPVIGTAPTSAPRRSAPILADRLRGLARRMVLIAAAVGVGFVVAALFQGPAAADGIRGGSGDEPRRDIAGLIERVARFTVAERPGQDHQRTAGADDRHRDRRPAPPAGSIGGIVALDEDAPSPTPPRRTGTSRVSVPPPRVGASDPSGAAEREPPRPAPVARAAHRSAHRVNLPRPPAAVAPDAPAPHGRADSPVAGLITAALPSVVDIVATVPVRPVVMALLRVADAVLPPALLPTTPPAAPPRSAPPASGPSTAPAADPAPAAPTPPADPVLAPVPAAVPPVPATPPPMPVVGPAPPTTSAGHHAARAGPVAAAAEFSGQPVAPVDQDAAGVGGKSTPGPGLVWPLDRPAQFGAGQPCDLVPLLVESRNLSPITRPG